ncbi:MAG TPA: GNAT family N-acetyltransferase [Candidatus Binataceae bacterium]|nr:GNAT family N-acetyltransferase [Candidatus Binataceae bacterium]
MDRRERPKELVRIRARELSAIPAAGVAIERLSVLAGLPPLEASRFRFVVEEMCADRIANGFADTQAPAVDIRLEHRPGEIVSVLDDNGMPVDSTSTTAGARGMMGQFLERGFVDELHASFRGREGNRCTAIKFLGKDLSGLQSVATTPPVTNANTPDVHNTGATSLDEVKYRPMLPEDAYEVARCFYRTYGLSAPSADEVIYHPDRCAERVRAGLHLATVAIDGSHRVVGHTALERETINDPIATGGYLVVDPDYRGRGIAERLTEIRFKEGRQLGLRGMLAMAVTLHTASQKTSLANGGHEVGILLAAQEARIIMRGIAAHQGHERHSIVAFYFPWADMGLDSYPPSVLREVISSIYANCGIERTLKGKPEGVDLSRLPAHSMLDVSILHAASHARIRVKGYGRDFLAEVLHLVHDLHHHNVKVIRLELPLSDPLTALFGSAAEELGFSFAAVFPGTADGDILCLQSLHGIEINPADIQTASEYGSALLAAVIKSRERVLSSKSVQSIEGAERAFRLAAEGG